MFLSNKLKELSEILINIDDKVGFKNFLKYAVLGFIIIVLINYKTIIRDSIEFITIVKTDIHNQKLELRDELLAELGPILLEFRSETLADRVLYFEYHNSKENLVSIPFKYVELVQQSARYSISNAPEERYRDINTGAITSIYEKIKGGEIVHCSGPEDIEFMRNYSGVYDLINSRDNSKQHVFISIPGISQPIGMIILEWLSTDSEVSVDRIDKIAKQNYIPRINALILSKRLR